MAEVLEHFDFDNRRGNKEMYDWKSWLDGRVWALAPGTDFEGKPEDFRTTVYSAAERYKVKVRTSVVELGVEVTDESGKVHREMRPHLVIRAMKGPPEGDDDVVGEPEEVHGQVEAASVQSLKEGDTTDSPREEVRLIRP